MSIIKRIKQAVGASNSNLDIEGSTSEAELSLLERLAGDVGAGQAIIEIGSHCGRSTCALAMGSKSGNSPPVFAIDPHVEYVGVNGRQFGASDLAEMYHNLHRFNVGDVVKVLALPSDAAGAAWKIWKPMPIGLLWIDGDHSYGAVRADIDGFSPYLSSSGLVALHDSRDPGPARLIEEVAAEGWGIKEVVDRITVLGKA